VVSRSTTNWVTTGVFRRRSDCHFRRRLFDRWERINTNSNRVGQHVHKLHFSNFIASASGERRVRWWALIFRRISPAARRLDCVLTRIWSRTAAATRVVVQDRRRTVVYATAAARRCNVIMPQHSDVFTLHIVTPPHPTPPTHATRVPRSCHCRHIKSWAGHQSIRMRKYPFVASMLGILFCHHVIRPPPSDRPRKLGA